MHARLLPADNPTTVRDALLALICHPRERLLGRYGFHDCSTTTTQHVSAATSRLLKNAA